MFGFLRKSKVSATVLLYNTVVEHSRNPYFYLHTHVADNLDGRFDLIVLHLVLTLRRLQDIKDPAFSSELQDRFFRDMDRNLREMGVGDISVPKKIKKMGEAFMGRSKVYSAALDTPSNDDLIAALKRNITAAEAKELGAVTIANYTRAQMAHLNTIADDDLRSGMIHLLTPQDALNESAT